jgi:hypothetical protein
MALDPANRTATGLVTNGVHVWVTDAGLGRVFVYTVDGSTVGSWPLDGANRDPSGITLDPKGGNDLWVVDRTQRRVYTYRGGLDWRSDSEPAAGSFPLSAGQSHPEDIADPPPAEPITGVPLQTEYGTTSFADETSTLHVDLRLRHSGSYVLRDPVWIGVRHLSRADVRLLGADGYAEGQIPYIDIASFLPERGFEPGVATDTITLRFHNPSRAPFTYELVVFPSVNRAPEITSTPVLFARPNGGNYRYGVQATDPDEDTPLRFELIESPQGMAIDSETGVITWTTLPGSQSVGTHGVSVRVVDPFGLHATQRFQLEVLPLDAGNRPPAWVSEPIVSAFVATDYEYLARARDVDGDGLRFSLLRGPIGLEIDEVTGGVHWRPQDQQLGIHEVVLRVHDDGWPSLSADQEFQILVGKQPGNNDPRIVSNPSSIYNVVTTNLMSGPVTTTQGFGLLLEQGGLL